MGWLNRLQNPQKHLIKALLLISCLIVAGHLVTLLIGEQLWVFSPYQTGRIKRIFNLAGESNIPTWFSSLLLALAARAAHLCARQSLMRHQRRVWMFLAAMLLLMSCDEVAMLHEDIARFIRQHIFTWVSQSPFGRYCLAVTIGPFIALAVAWFAVNLREGLRDSHPARNLLVMGVILFFGGAMGVGAMENFLQPEGLDWARKLQTIVEESLEMLGSIVFLAGLMEHQAMSSAKNACKAASVPRSFRRPVFISK